METIVLNGERYLNLDKFESLKDHNMCIMFTKLSYKDWTMQMDLLWRNEDYKDMFNFYERNLLVNDPNWKMENRNSNWTELDEANKRIKEMKENYSELIRLLNERNDQINDLRKVIGHKFSNTN